MLKNTGYRTEQESPAFKSDPIEEGEWSTGLCDCIDGGVGYCLFAAIFPCIVFGLNAQNIESGSQETCIWASLLCLVLGPFCGSSCYGCAYRSQLRGERGFKVLLALIFVRIFGAFLVLFVRSTENLLVSNQVTSHGYTLFEDPDTSPYLSSFETDKLVKAPSLQRMSRGTFTYEEMAEATNNFSDSRLIGQGGFGHVYKGLLSNSTIVAIKRLKPGSGQGEREFRAEIETISKVNHRNLVSLAGYCISGEQRMLVYEFVDNGNLDFHLHEQGNPGLNWSIRMKIAVGAAKGLAYLHEECHPKIIHRDIKASNILLDSNFEPKLSDFGLAKHSSDTETHVSTRIMGTFGYLAPDYATTGQLTDKSDVYSFGDVLLELLTGQKAIIHNPAEDISLVDWAKPLLKIALEEGNVGPLVDPKLQKESNSDEIWRSICCAAACIRRHAHAQSRPNMSQIVRVLEGRENVQVLEEISHQLYPI